MSIINYLFTDSLNKVDFLILSVSLSLFINRKYKYSVLWLLLGGIMIAIIEVILGI